MIGVLIGHFIRGVRVSHEAGIFTPSHPTRHVADDREPPETLRRVRDAWLPSAFWMSRPLTACFPLIAVHPDLFAYAAEHPHPRIRLYPKLLRSDHTGLVRAQRAEFGRHVVAYADWTGIRTPDMWDMLLDLRPYLRDLDELPTGAAKATLQWLFNPFLCPETAFTQTGAYAWEECEALSKSLKRKVPSFVPTRLIKRLLKICFTTGRPRTPISNKLLDELLAYNAEGDRRTMRYKQRHKFDLVSIIYAAADAWGRGPYRSHLISSMHATLCMMSAARMNYERMLVSFTYIYSSGYWPMIAQLELQESSHLLGLTDWIRLHKEYTATVVRTWTWPYTHVQTMASLYLVDAQTAVGWADNAPDGGDSLLATLMCAAGDRTTYVVPGRGEEAYYEAFERHATELLTEQFAAGADRATTMDRYCELRCANMSAGSAGGLVRSEFGGERIPPGCSKAYAAAALTREEFASQRPPLITVVDKPDERGVQRGLAAADLFTVRDEQFSFAPISKGMIWTGADIGESDIQRGDRVLRQVAFAISRATISCFDWEKFDRYMALLEKLGLMRAGKVAANVLVDESVRADVQAAFDRVIQSHERATFRSPAYALDMRGAEVDAAIAAAPGRLKRLSPTDIEVTGVEAQQSGRGNTLESNGEIAEIRVRIRDEIAGTQPVERDGRGDDLFEAYERWSDAVEATLTFTDMGNKANLRKLTIQDHSGVYFKVVHIGGSRPSRRGMPARVALSLVSSKPAIGVAPFPSFSESISGGTSNCNRGIRRGLSVAFCRALAKDCVEYNCRTVPQVTKVLRRRQKSRAGRLRGPKLKRTKRSADPRFIVADQIHGGLGILPPGVMKTDTRLKCVEQVGCAAIRTDLSSARKRLVRAAELPGIDELVSATALTFREQHGFDPPPDALETYAEMVALGSTMQDGSGDLSMLVKGEAQLRAYARVHLDSRTTLLQVPMRVSNRCRLMVISMRQALDMQRDVLHVNRAPLQGMEALQAELPGVGLLASLDRGLAKEVVQAAPPGDRMRLATQLCATSTDGRVFIERTMHWPEWLRLHILLGTHLFPGGWGGLISPDLFGLFKMVCYVGLEDDIDECAERHRLVFESHCRWSAIIDCAGRFFYSVMSDFCLE